MIYAIGDLHGRFDLLCTTLSTIEAHAGAAGGTFICLGDFIDRGPQSRSNIDLLMAGPSLPNWRWIVLKGNHEDIMLQALRDPERKLVWWLQNGGGATLHSYGYEHGDDLHPLKVPATHLHWLDGLPIMHKEEHHVFVHAGVDPARSLEEQSPELVMWKLYEKDDEGGHGLRHVVHGHHQFADGPILKEGRTDLDTYAWLYGRQGIGVFDPAKPGGPVEMLWAVGPPDPRL